MSTWTSISRRGAERAERVLASFRRTRDQKLGEAAQGLNPMGLDLTFIPDVALTLLLARTPEIIREELRPLAPTARAAAEQMFTRFFRPGDTIGLSALAAASGVCTYECFGLDVGDSLSIFKPHLVSVETSPRMEYPYRHWNRALVAIALDEPRVWRPIAGLLPHDPLPFEPGATFEFNLQGVVRHLAAAVQERRPAEEVLPAWHDLVRSYPYLERAALAELDTLLWAARIVFHHLGGQPLGTVAEVLREAIQAAVANERA